MSILRFPSQPGLDNDLSGLQAAQPSFNESETMTEHDVLAITGCFLGRVHALLWYLDPDGEQPLYTIRLELAKFGLLKMSPLPENPTAQCYDVSHSLTPEGRKIAHLLRGLARGPERNCGNSKPGAREG